MAQCDWHESDDHISPHFGHTLQTWGDGSWLCTTCEGIKCDKCLREDVDGEGEICGECLSEEAEYWAENREERSC